MTETAPGAVEADVRLPQRRWRAQASWPVFLASLLLHLALAVVLYPGGSAPPEAPTPLFIVDVVLRAPGAPALPEGANAGTPGPPATAAAAALAAAAVARSVQTAPSQAPATVAAVAPAATAAVVPAASIAAAAPAAAAPMPSPLTALKAPTTASASSPPTAAVTPATPTPRATVSVVRALSAAQAAAATPPLAAAAVVVQAATAPAVNIAGGGQRSASFVAQAATPSAARIAPSVGPPPSVQAGVAPVLSPDPARTLQTARPTLPPPPLPPRKPPSLLARERNPRIIRENARIVGAPLPLIEDMPPAGALAVGGPLGAETASRPDSRSGSRAANARGRQAARPASTGRAGSDGRSGRQGAAGAATPADYRGAGFWNPPPTYPFQARRRGLEGQVVVRVVVTPAGRAKSVSVRRSSGHRVLDRAALAAVRDWRFKPAARDGKPVGGAVDVPVTFRLNQ